MVRLDIKDDYITGLRLARVGAGNIFALRQNFVAVGLHTLSIWEELAAGQEVEATGVNCCRIQKQQYLQVRMGFG